LSDQVLLLTHSADYYTIDRVADAVRHRGAEPIRVDTDHFPVDLGLSMRIDADLDRRTLKLGDEVLHLDTVRAVWARRLWPGRMPAHLDAQFRGHCRTQARTAFFDTFALLNDATWVNPLGPLFEAESKIRQLHLARQVGLKLPRTLITNQAERVRRFYENCGGKVVTKLLSPLSQTMDGRGVFMYTSALSPDDLDDLEALRFAPQIFQERVEKAVELRVILIGGRLFVGEIRVSGTGRGTLDWRQINPQDTQSNVTWAPGVLPLAVGQKLQRLLRLLNLTYAAVDLIVDPEGHHFFLEVNPAGEWGWLERDLGFDISGAIADALLTKRKT
jgi:glutathione synthase/RimK-type ligase-like ATP-grasp enzyme